MSRELALVQQNLHDLIRSRAAALLDAHQVALPILTVEQATSGETNWFPIPGMYGGFAFRFLKDRTGIVLESESWSRVVSGSGQRHEITATGCGLVEEEFV